jgi:tetratricopeptide (TPR) repeat protein
MLEWVVSLCQDTDLQGYIPRVAPALGAAYTLAGHVAAAVPLLTQALAQTTARETVAYQALCSLPLSEAPLLAGRLDEAYALAEGALSHTRAYQERAHQAYALRLLGDIAARREPPDSESTEAHYRQALALAEDLGIRPLVAHCHRGLGTLYSQTGRAALAHATLSTAILMYRAMDMTFWLPQAEAALAQGKGPVSSLLRPPET